MTKTSLRRGARRNRRNRRRPPRRIHHAVDGEGLARRELVGQDRALQVAGDGELLLQRGELRLAEPAPRADRATSSDRRRCCSTTRPDICCSTRGNGPSWSSSRISRDTAPSEAEASVLPLVTATMRPRSASTSSRAPGSSVSASASIWRRTKRSCRRRCSSRCRRASPKSMRLRRSSPIASAICPISSSLCLARPPMCRRGQRAEHGDRAFERMEAVAQIEVEAADRGATPRR